MKSAVRVIIRSDPAIRFATTRFNLLDSTLHDIQPRSLYHRNANPALRFEGSMNLDDLPELVL